MSSQVLLTIQSPLKNITSTTKILTIQLIFHNGWSRQHHAPLYWIYSFCNSIELKELKFSISIYMAVTSTMKIHKVIHILTTNCLHIIYKPLRLVVVTLCLCQVLLYVEIIISEFVNDIVHNLPNTINI